MMHANTILGLKSHKIEVQWVKYKAVVGVHICCCCADGSNVPCSKLESLDQNFRWYWMFCLLSRFSVHPTCLSYYFSHVIFMCLAFSLSCFMPWLRSHLSLFSSNSLSDCISTLLLSPLSICSQLIACICIIEFQTE